MKLNNVKRSVVVLAAVFAAMSTSAVAESTKAVQLSDAELDGITAGFAQVVIINPGNANVLRMNEDGSRAVCVNCELVSEFLPRTGPAFGVVTVENPNGPKLPTAVGKPHFPF